MSFDSGSGPPEHSFAASAALGSCTAADVDAAQSTLTGIVGAGASAAGPQRPPVGCTEGPDLAELAQKWRSVAAKAEAWPRYGSAEAAAASNGSSGSSCSGGSGGGSGSGVGAEGPGADRGQRWDRQAYKSLIGPTCEALDAGPHHFVHAYRHLPREAGAGAAGAGGRSLDVAALVDVTGAVVTLNRLAGFEPPWDFRRSLVAAATEAVRSATWPQAAALLRDTLALQSVGRVFFARLLARIGLALYKEGHLGEAAAVHGALRAAFGTRYAVDTGSATVGGRFGSARDEFEGGRPVTSSLELRVSHYRRAFSRQLARAGQPPLSDADILAAETAMGVEETASLLSSIAMMLRGGHGDVSPESEGAALSRQVAGTFRWLLAYLPPLLPTLPGGPAAVLPALREISSCGWNHSGWVRGDGKGLLERAGQQPGCCSEVCRRACWGIHRPIPVYLSLPLQRHKFPGSGGNLPGLASPAGGISRRRAASGRAPRGPVSASAGASGAVAWAAGGGAGVLCTCGRAPRGADGAGNGRGGAGAARLHSAAGACAAGQAEVDGWTRQRTKAGEHTGNRPGARGHGQLTA